MATWNSLAQPVSGPPREQPDFFGRTKTGAVRQLSLPKVPGADPAILGSFQDYARNRGMARSDLTGFRRAFGSTQPMVQQFANQDIGEIGRYFSPGGYEADLAGIRDRRAGALSALDDQILRSMKRTLDSRAIGTGTPGMSSYLARLAASEAGRLRTAEVYDAAGQERADLAALMTARSGSAGRRQTILDSALARLLVPGQQEQASLGASNTNLSNALQMALANLVSAYATPY